MTNTVTTSATPKAMERAVRADANARCSMLRQAIFQRLIGGIARLNMFQG